MKKLLLISSIFLSLSINAQKLTPTSSINQPGSADSFWGGYTFAYATSGTPYNGALMSFGGFNWNNYDCQLSSSYFQSQLAFRTRNGDAGLWNPWLNIVTVGAGSAPNHLTKFGQINDLANSIIYDDGTNVGIGTNPDYKLTVNGNFKTINGNNEFSYNGAADIILKYADRGTGGRAIVHDGGNTLVLNYGNDFNGGTRIGNNVFFKEGGNSFVNTGNVGIGTATPAAKLDVVGEINMLGRIGMYINNPAQCFTYDGKTMGHYSIGWLQENTCTASGPSLLMSGYGSVKLFTTGVARLAINNQGKVGIGLSNPDVTMGTTPSDEMLTVNGAIHAKEVRVDLTGSLADYVFHPTYKLMPLHQVEQYVNTNSHLPEMPSAEEVSKNGMSMGEMQNKLLQKVEELTLYVIEQQKEIEELKKNQK